MSRSLRVWYSAVCAVGATAIAGGLALSNPASEPALGQAPAMSTDVVLISTASTADMKKKAKANQKWQSSFSAAMGPLNDSIKAFDTAAKGPDYPGMQAACEQMRTAANAMGATMPSPREELTAALQGAIGDFKSAGSKCDTLTPDAGQDAIQSVVNDVQNGVSGMQSASAIVNSESQ